MEVTVSIPDELYSDLETVAEQLKQNPSECLQLALHHFLLTDTVDNAIEGITRMNDGQDLVDFPELKEELGLEIRFHPQAMAELESLEEDDQLDILEQIITRISQQADEEEEAAIDLILKQNTDSQVVLSGFSFGDIVYQQGNNVIIYHIALIEEDSDEDEEDDEDYDEDEEELEDYEDEKSE